MTTDQPDLTQFTAPPSNDMVPNIPVTTKSIVQDNNPDVTEVFVGDIDETKFGSVTKENVVHEDIPMNIVSFQQQDINIENEKRIESTDIDLIDIQQIPCNDSSEILADVVSGHTTASSDNKDQFTDNEKIVLDYDIKEDTDTTSNANNVDIKTDDDMGNKNYLINMADSGLKPSISNDVNETVNTTIDLPITKTATVIPVGATHDEQVRPTEVIHCNKGKNEIFHTSKVERSTEIKTNSNNARNVVIKTHTTCVPNVTKSYHKSNAPTDPVKTQKPPITGLPRVALLYKVNEAPPRIQKPKEHRSDATPLIFRRDGSYIYATSINDRKKSQTSTTSNKTPRPNLKKSQIQSNNKTTVQHGINVSVTKELKNPMVHESDDQILDSLLEATLDSVSDVKMSPDTVQTMNLDAHRTTSKVGTDSTIQPKNLNKESFI